LDIDGQCWLLEYDTLRHGYDNIAHRHPTHHDIRLPQHYHGRKRMNSIFSRRHELRYGNSLMFTSPLSEEHW
jgi:hypothetical protein